MSLTEFQSALARLLSTNRNEESYLAGGAAILMDAESTRYSNDLDYFHDSEQRVAEASAADHALLREHGYECDTDVRQPGYVRSVVRRNGEGTKVEWAHNSSWRFMPVERDERVGFVLHPVDWAVNKVLALAGRDEPRDVLDALHLHGRVLPLGALCWAACGKDPGFTPLSCGAFATNEPGTFFCGVDRFRIRGTLMPMATDAVIRWIRNPLTIASNGTTGRLRR